MRRMNDLRIRQGQRRPPCRRLIDGRQRGGRKKGLLAITKGFRAEAARTQCEGGPLVSGMAQLPNAYDVFSFLINTKHLRDDDWRGDAVFGGKETSQLSTHHHPQTHATPPLASPDALSYYSTPNAVTRAK